MAPLAFHREQRRVFRDARRSTVSRQRRAQGARHGTAGRADLRVLGKAEQTASGAARPGVRDSQILAAALTLSCIGDVFLHLGPRRYFGQALGAFLLAHVAYTLLFVRSWRRPFRPGGVQLILAAAVLVYSMVVTGWLASGLGEHAVPVMVYSGAITAMTVSAILAGFSMPFVWIGAMLFVVSDSLIAIGRFKTALPLTAYLIWPTYYLAQYGIAIGPSAGEGRRPLTGMSPARGHALDR